MVPRPLRLLVLPERVELLRFSRAAAGVWFWLALALSTSLAVIPVLFAVATGVAVGALPDAIAEGFPGQAGHRIQAALAVASLLFLGQAVVGAAYAVVIADVTRRVDDAVSDRVLALLNRPSTTAHLESPAVLDAVSTARSQGTGRTLGAASAASLRQWQRLASGVLALAVVAGYRWWLALVLLLVRAGVLRETRRQYLSSLRAITERTQALRRSNYLGDVLLAPDAAKETRVFGLAGWFSAEHQREWIEAMAPIWAARRQEVRLAGGTAALVLVAHAAAFLLLARSAARGDLSLTGFAVYSQTVVAAGVTAAFGAAIADVAYGSLALSGLSELARLVPEADLASQQVPCPPHVEEICFDDVRFAYPGGIAVLEGLSLTLRRGESLAIVGLNGAGKTTLVKLLCGFHRPISGRITVNGTDLAAMDVAEWRTHIAAVFQDFLRLELSAADNVTLCPLQANDRGLLDTVAGLAGLEEVITTADAGWETILNRQYKGGTELSGGQWQRVALARALWAVEHGADVVVFDEPTASLDVRAETELTQRLLDVTADAVTIVISHRLSTVRRADRIAVIEGGRVVEDGDHRSLMSLHGRYAELFNAQAAHFVDTGALDG